jgi:predicted SPOUT superfamily RNA methylase MTH1
MPSKDVNQISLPLSIALPTSFIDISQNKAQKTQHIGRIARAAAIFQVDEIILYRDNQNPRQTKNLQFITHVLEYMETPQYLRKHLFGKIPELQYAGLLPPLRTPHHPLTKKSSELKNGEIRDGVVLQTSKGTIVDVGVESPLPLLQFKFTQSLQRVTVRIRQNKSGELIAIPCSSLQPNLYWGYSVRSVETSLTEFLTKTRREGPIVATSRRGTPLEDKAEQIKTQWQTTNHLLLLFGSHKEGLTEILQRDKTDMTAVVDYSINLVLHQGTATIRTEEAVVIGLSAFRFLERLKT